MALTLGRDIVFSKFDQASGSVTFTIRNAAVVDAFLADEARLTFLRDPLLADDAAHSGCGITLDTTTPGKLTITAAGGAAGTPALLSVLKTYVIPYLAEDDYNPDDWRRLAGPAGIAEPETIAENTLPRGVAWRGDPMPADVGAGENPEAPHFTG